MKKILFIALFLLTSCSGLSKGITQAILEHKDEDRRKCLIAAEHSNGINDFLEDDRYDTIKVLFVHGIGNKQPGNSLTLLYNLSEELGFTTWSKDF